ncbi:chemotaxis protein methyltransferase CheR [Methylorubrum rhodinum]|uniref:protein-glutamate O-methyltransferase n=1 Tax=Methylorubrum rhodinum TaxID=29428 RepID=A0A840ZDP5_9HYPH|nr:protein-glutamate O-methyltransferase CheR [Methylorubrum rhodinum]MBB5755749.1 chemotaxis protein methyltransferase CheR [Methylorubrum rhodinum]
MTRPSDRVRRAAGAVADPGFPALKERVIARTGHSYYVDKDDLLHDRVRRRLKACGLPDCTAYLARLDGPGGRDEWAALEAEITIGETFFFRYAEQFAALRGRILPDLIAARGDVRALRVWSAGCSTGAEPYSLAILLHELLGEALPEWSVTILGTDLSVEALATAREAEFGPWALRTLGEPERLRWFRRVPARPGRPHGAYALRPVYRRMVRFERQNLLSLIDGPQPSMGTTLGATLGSNFDLILCRNVLIYFNAEHVNRIVRALGERLQPGGWLLIGHAEPNPAFAQWLEPVTLPGTVAYRPAGTEVVAQAQVPLPPWVPEVPPAFVPPPRAGPPPIPPPPPTAPAVATAEPDDLLREVRNLADAGETAQAWRLLQEGIGGRGTEPALRYYEGLLALDLGREAEAERALRGALFLDRGFVMAHYQLGLLLARGRRRGQAARALDNALRLAQGLPPETILPEGDGVSAQRLAENARALLSGMGGPSARDPA